MRTTCERCVADLLYCDVHDAYFWRCCGSLVGPGLIESETGVLPHENRRSVACWVRDFRHRGRRDLPPTMV